MFDNRWQVKTLDTRTGSVLCTTEMPSLEGFGLPSLGYRYESCLFLPCGDSDVLARYDDQAAALEGHERLVQERMGSELDTQQGVTQED